jgi:glycerophosphoryl diester phosphodiesterase
MTHGHSSEGSLSQALRRAPGALPLVIAHRGASTSAPENTLAAFDLARRQGADGVELDVQTTRDGCAVVAHDRTLRRTTGDRRRVDAVALEELATLDCGSWFDAGFSGERIPPLDEALDRLRGMRIVNIEMKGSSPDLVDAVIAAVRATATESSVLLSSFDHRLVLAALHKAPRIARATLVHPLDRGEPSRAARAVGAAAIVLSRRQLRRERIADARRHGLGVIVYTVDLRADIARCLAAGVDGIITNDPGGTRKVLEELRSGTPHA